MDVIDLCDEDEDITPVIPEDPLATDNSENLEPAPSTDFQIVSVKSLSALQGMPSSNSSATSSSGASSSSSSNSNSNKTNEDAIPAKRANRRKTIHQPIIDRDDEAQFIEQSSYDDDDNNPENNNEFIDVSELPTKNIISNLNKTPKTNESTDILALMDRIKKIPNPNKELLKRVAFLRVSVQFTLQELGIKSFTINKNCNIQTLKAQYQREKKALRK